MNANLSRKVGALCAAMVLAPMVTLSGAAGLATAGLEASHTNADLALRPHTSLVATSAIRPGHFIICLACQPANL